MTLNELKQSIDLEDFILNHGWSYNKIKSTKKHNVFSDGSNNIILAQGNDCKIYYTLGDHTNKGTIIDFVQRYILQDKNLNKVEEFLNKEMGKSYKKFSSLLSNSVKAEFTANNFYISKYKNINSYAFLALKNKNISQTTLNSEVFNNVGEITKHFNNIKITNVAFPLFDNKERIRAIDYRYTQKEKGLTKEKKMFVTGSEKELSIGLSSSKKEGKQILFLCESPVDAMAHYQLHMKERTEIQYVYFDGTISRNQIQTFLDYKSSLEQTNGALKVVVGFDNDDIKKAHGQGYGISLLLSSMLNEVVMVSNKTGELMIHTEKENSYKAIEKLFKDNKIEHTKDSSFRCVTFAKNSTIIEKVNNAIQSDKLLFHVPKGKDWCDDLKETIIKKKINKGLQR